MSEAPPCDPEIFSNAGAVILRAPDAYTLGNADNYDRALSEEGPVMKLGKQEDYAGGIVFPTKADADAYLARHPELPYKVYGLFLPNRWKTDVQGEMLPGEDFYRLLNDAEVVQLENT
jgi:hypothetical protein